MKLRFLVLLTAVGAAAFVLGLFARDSPRSPGHRPTGDSSNPEIGRGGAPVSDPRGQRQRGRFRSARRDGSEEGAFDFEAAAEELRNLGYLAGSNEAPELVGVTAWDPKRAWDGLNLVVDGHAPEARLIDMAGTVLHTWRYPFERAFGEIDRSERSITKPEVHMWRRVALAGDGSLFAIYEGQGVIKIDRGSKLLWKYPRAHHDLEIQPDGRLFVLTREVALDPRVHETKPVLLDAVTVLSPDGELLREIPILDAIRRSDFRRLEVLMPPHGDLLHNNTLEVLDGRLGTTLPAFRKGNVLLSMHRIHTIAVLDVEREAIVWALTGLTARQHDPKILDDGRMLVFDNNPGPEETSRVLEIDPNTQQVHWSYEQPDGGFYSRTCGAAQRLANGNTLITETDYGRAFEVTTTGEIVWEYLTPNRAGESDELIASLFEVIRLEPSAVASWLDVSRYAPDESDP